MKADRFAQQLAAAGLDSFDVSDKSRLFDVVAARFTELTSTSPSHAWWVPGRLEVFGTHTDYAGGRTLIAALPRGFALAAARRSDGRLRVVDAGNREQVVLDRRSESSSGWRRYVQVVWQRLHRNFPGMVDGADIVFVSDLPRAAGMSSSSALIVGVGTAIARLWNLHGSDRWRRCLSRAEELATFLASIESGRTFAELEGDEGVGTHGGSEDHAAMLLAQPHRVTAFSFVPLRRLADAIVPDTWRFVVASSGVPSEKTGTAREPYNQLSRQTTALLDLWNAHESAANSLSAALESDKAAVDRLHHLIRTGSLPESEREALHRRLQHFRAEDGLVMPALRAFETSDAQSLGELSRRSQQSAEDVLRNQIAETVALVREACSQGAIAARTFGAGFGGSAWALVHREHAREFAREWLAKYRHTCAHASGATAFVAAPGPPLTELTCA